MDDLSPLAFNAIVAGVALLLYVFVWWATASLPRNVRVLARLFLAVLALSPLALSMMGARLSVFLPFETVGSAPEPTTAARPPGQPQTYKFEQPERPAPDRAAPARPREPVEPPAKMAARDGPAAPGAPPLEAVRREAEQRAAEEARRAAEASRAEEARRAAEQALREAEARHATELGARAPAPMAAAPPAPAPQPSAPSPAGGAAPPAPAARSAPPPVAAAPPAAVPPGTPAAPDTSAPPPTASPPPAAANGAPTRGTPRVAARPAPPAGEAKRSTGPFASDSEDWDVVPVFYGTDRRLAPSPARIDYGSERGKRLQLGTTLVTVPKTHEVPQVERPWVYRLPFTAIELFREAEDPKRHFTLKDIKELGRAEFVALVRKRLADSLAYKDHALVFVHGFNTSFDHAIYRTAQIAYDLKFDGAPFLYSWPSKGQLGLQDYSYDRESAGQAEPYLREFLELVARETGAKSLSVIAHSMGNQLLLPVLRDLRRQAPPGVEISQVILAAPDVDRDNFEFLMREVQGVSRGVTMFSAANDWALEASKQFWGGVPRAGDVPPEGPLVLPGLDTIDVTAINTDILSLNHSGYAEKTALLNDIQLLIQTGERPPEKRIPILERVVTPAGPYWKYPGSR